MLLHVTINIVLMVFELVICYLKEDIQVYVCFGLDVPYLCIMFHFIQYVY